MFRLSLCRGSDPITKHRPSSSSTTGPPELPQLTDTSICQKSEMSKPLFLPPNVPLVT